MLLTKYKVQELVEDVKLEPDEVEKYMKAMHITPEPYLAAFTAIMAEVLKDKIIDELGRAS